MRFYTFDFSEIDILPSQGPDDSASKLGQTPIDTNLAADFTREAPPVHERATFNGEVLSQVSIQSLCKVL